MKQATLKTGGSIVIPKLWIARDFFSRFLGLMGRRGLPGDEGVLFPKCNSVHTFFMRFPIDVVMLDGENRVVEVVESMPAWRLLLPRSKAKHVIELTARRSKEIGIVPGVTLEWQERSA